MIKVKRLRNQWVSLQNNFCTPLAVWEIDLEKLNERIGNEFRQEIVKLLNRQFKVDFKVCIGAQDLLTLVAARLHSCNSDEVFNWLIQFRFKQFDHKFCYPFLDEKVAGQIGPVALNFLLKGSRIYSNETDRESKTEEIATLFNSHLRQIEHIIPHASSLRILIEAKKRLIPTRRHSDLPSYQLGYGVKKKVVHLGYTNHTSQLSTIIATHKHAAANLLKESGLPTPLHFTVATIDDAISAAKRLNFPLVVKPTSADKGLGVTVGIQNETELSAAFTQASRYGTVLLEEFLEGLDHRLHVIDGKCAYVVRRVPPFVIGDGVSTINTLISLYARNRSADPEYKRFQNADASDPHVLEHLKKQGLFINSVPTRNRIIYLRSNSNVSTGGFAEEVTKICHPDNILLAQRAARLIGLDNAGVDYITTNISISWLDSGGKITEINPTPAFGKDRSYIKLLDYLYPGTMSGRIPIVLLVGRADRFTEHLELAINRYTNHKKHYAYIFNQELYIYASTKSSRIKSKRTQDVLIGLLADPAVEAALIQIDFAELELGLELHYISMLIAVGDDREISHLLQSDVASRSEEACTLVNPSFDDYRVAIESLPLN